MVNRLNPGDVVLITGGCGFLGKHLIQLLAEKMGGLAEIRVLDLEPRPANFELDNPNIKLNFVVGDIRDEAVMDQVFRGVDVVMHAASFVDTSNIPELHTLHSVNVQGTENVLKACIKNNVEYIIYTGTSEVSRGHEVRANASEEDIDALQTKNFVMKGYSESKQLAENMILKANGQVLPNGNTIKSVSLRPIGIYGEGDKVYVTGVLKVGQTFFGLMPCLGSPQAQIQRVYVGNVAWAHICTLMRMKEDTSVCGKPYIITDHTAISSNFLWMKPFMEARQIKLLPINIPLVLLYYIFAIIEFFCSLILPLAKIRMLSSKGELVMACTTCYYNGNRARNYLGYRPLYSAKEAFKRSYEWYSLADL